MFKLPLEKKSEIILKAGDIVVVAGNPYYLVKYNDYDDKLRILDLRTHDITGAVKTAQELHEFWCEGWEDDYTVYSQSEWDLTLERK